jgi:hypothetical protein
MRHLLLLSLLLLSLPAAAAGPEFTPKPPDIMPKEAAAFWAQVHKHALAQAEKMIADKAPELGYRRQDYTKGDMNCMWWFSAWASVEAMRSKNPMLCPASFTKWLEQAKDRACNDEDPPNTPGAATGRGWNTVRRAILGRSDVQKEVTPASAISWAARAGVALPALEWGAGVTPSLGVPIVNPNALPDVRPSGHRKTNPNDVL